MLGVVVEVSNSGNLKSCQFFPSHVLRREDFLQSEVVRDALGRVLLNETAVCDQVRRPEACREMSQV